MKSSSLVYELILDYLSEDRIEIKKMFGHQCLYFDGLMVMFLIAKSGNPDNGICIATSKEHIPALTKEFKNLRHLHAYGPEATDWRLIPADSEYFESDTEKACRLIIKRDRRIGRAPKGKKLSPTKKKKVARK